MNDESELQSAVAQSRNIVLIGQVVESNTDLWNCVLTRSQHFRQDTCDGRGRVTDMQFAFACVCGRARFLNGGIRVLQNLASFLQENAARLSQADRFRGALEQCDANLILEIADLPAECRL